MHYIDFFSDILITYNNKKKIQDELEAELEELEGAELESQLLEPVAAPPSHPVHVPTKQPARPAPQKATAEDDELAALQAEMAL